MTPTYLIFTDDKFYYMVHQPRIHKRRVPRLSGDNALKRCLIKAKERTWISI